MLKLFRHYKCLVLQIIWHYINVGLVETLNGGHLFGPPSGVTTRGEVRQLPQGAERQGALEGAFGRRIVCFALQNSAEFLNDRNLVYLYSFRTMKVHL